MVKFYEGAFHTALGSCTLMPVVIFQGPHGYFIQPIDLTERAAINKEYEEMLARLCKNQGSVMFAKGERSILRNLQQLQIRDKFSGVTVFIAFHAVLEV